ncbi:MAG: T9SS type A sorting domain-containing protein [Crocinitomix sp.]|nr:T9SS type A sorting domain-containing protein [Crocinitomix sp.]
MKTFWILLVFVSLIGNSQVVRYSPNRKIEKTVSQNYYDTEFLFLKNITSKSLDLSFEVIENTLNPNWSATFCTNLQCYSQIPDFGSLGSLAPESEAYFSFNFSANETLGTGQVRILITSTTSAELSDTVTFKYKVTEDGTVKAGPWANINYGQGVLTVLLQNPEIKTTLQVIDMNGKFIFDQEIGHIISIPLRDYPKGLYIIAIRDENDRIIKEKLVHY